MLNLRVRYGNGCIHQKHNYQIKFSISFEFLRQFPSLRCSFMFNKLCSSLSHFLELLASIKFIELKTLVKCSLKITQWNLFRLYLDQALDLLVWVSWTCYHAYTPHLSTWWSSRSLTNLRYGKSHLRVGFTLRCFQRLSLPDIATQLCHWRDNWCTRGLSIPVLSY